MTYESQLENYLLDLNQEVRAKVESEEGGILEEMATEYFTEVLSRAGETECPQISTDIRQNSVRSVLHKINGYSYSEDEETIDCYVTCFEENNKLRSFLKANVEQAVGQVEKFLKSALNRYVEEIDEEAPIYNLAHNLSSSLFANKIIRIRIFVLTNSRCTTPFTLPDRKIKEISIQIHVWDLERFYRLESINNYKEPIEVKLEEDHNTILPCLAMPIENDNYQCYLTIIDGELLSKIYEKFGSRLLEQNVRSFLQFGNKVNKGIKETIRKEPTKFLAYNNGISATASSVEFTKSNTGLFIKSIHDLQIVNGGQTTAAIFQTKRQDKANISQVYVQMKLTVIKNQSDLETMVPLISRYANSQNAIKIADLSSNHPYNIELERLSRSIYTPALPDTQLQTRWFFERARGQYKVSLLQELNPKSKKTFEIKNPKSQIFTKEDVAKAMHSWNLFPFIVAKGSQKNYANFISNLKLNELPNSIVFEDLIAILLIQRAAEHCYGRGDSKIGDIKFITVPYTISIISFQISSKLDLFKIWKNQSLSQALLNTIKTFLPLVESLIREHSQNRLIGEYAKKEECWDVIKSNLHKFNLGTKLLLELTDAKINRKLKDDVQLDEVVFEQNSKRIVSLGAEGWRKIEIWARDSKSLSPHKQDQVSSIYKAILHNRKLTIAQVGYAEDFLNLVSQKNPSLFDSFTYSCITESSNPKISLITICNENIDAAILFDKTSKVLSIRDHEYLRKIAAQDRDLNTPEKSRVNDIFIKLERSDFIALK